MKILILGAGVVGSTIAERLSREPENEITVVDLDANILRAIHERMDVRTVAGHASHPAVLDHAGAGDADLVAALTGNDEVNMVACQVVHSRLPRVRAGWPDPHQDRALELHPVQRRGGAVRS